MQRVQSGVCEGGSASRMATEEKMYAVYGRAAAEEQEARIKEGVRRDSD